MSLDDLLNLKGEDFSKIPKFSLPCQHKVFLPKSTHNSKLPLSREHKKAYKYFVVPSIFFYPKLPSIMSPENMHSANATMLPIESKWLAKVVFRHQQKRYMRKDPFSTTEKLIQPLQKLKGKPLFKLRSETPPEHWVQAIQKRTVRSLSLTQEASIQATQEKLTRPMQKLQGKPFFKLRSEAPPEHLVPSLQKRKVRSLTLTYEASIQATQEKLIRPLQKLEGKPLFKLRNEAPPETLVQAIQKHKIRSLTLTHEASNQAAQEKLIQPVQKLKGNPFFKLRSESSPEHWVLSIQKRTVRSLTLIHEASIQATQEKLIRPLQKLQEKPFFKLRSEAPPEHLVQSIQKRKVRPLVLYPEASAQTTSQKLIQPLQKIEQKPLFISSLNSKAMLFILSELDKKIRKNSSLSEIKTHLLFKLFMLDADSKKGGLPPPSIPHQQNMKLLLTHEPELNIKSGSLSELPHTQIGEPISLHHNASFGQNPSNLLGMKMGQQVFPIFSLKNPLFQGLRPIRMKTNNAKKELPQRFNPKASASDFISFFQMHPIYPILRDLKTTLFSYDKGLQAVGGLKSPERVVNKAYLKQCKALHHVLKKVLEKRYKKDKKKVFGMAEHISWLMAFSPLRIEPHTPPKLSADPAWHNNISIKALAQPRENTSLVDRKDHSNTSNAQTQAAKQNPPGFKTAHSQDIFANYSWNFTAGGQTAVTVSGNQAQNDLKIDSLPFSPTPSKGLDVPPNPPIELEARLTPNGRVGLSGKPAKDGPPAVSYKFYYNPVLTDLAGSTPATGDKFYFEDPKHSVNFTKTYYVVSVSATGKMSSSVGISFEIS